VSVATGTVDSTTRPTTAHGVRRDHLVVGTLIGIAALVGVWAWFSARQPELILPSPSETLTAAVALAREGVLVAETATTIWRAVLAVSVAMVIGVVWGTLNGISHWAAAVSQPALAALMALPPIVLVVVGLTWFGPGAATTRLVVVLVALPLIVIAVAEAVRAVDTDLLEMAAAFGLRRTTILRHVIAPAITSPVLAAGSVALGQSLRVAVMAELLSAADGVGAQISRARANIETADVFAWALTLIIVVLTLELAVLRPLSRRLLRWRQPAAAAWSTPNRAP
jgi:NitT/TauT family transport system permease protein